MSAARPTGRYSSGVKFFGNQHGCTPVEIENIGLRKALMDSNGENRCLREEIRDLQRLIDGYHRHFPELLY